MKILFINAHERVGGAAIAMQRVARQIELTKKAEINFLVKFKNSDRCNVFCTTSNKFENMIERVIHKISSILGVPFQCFPYSTKRLLSITKKISPDIISLHNTHGIYFKTSLISELSKVAPIAWTLHDMWPITNNAAHTFGDESWKVLRSSKSEMKIYPAIGVNWNNFLIKQKRRVVQKSRLAAITPSYWLKDLVDQSPIFKGKEVRRIANGVDLDIFKPESNETTLESLEIKKGSKVCMFCAESLDPNNLWKGGQLLLDILGEIDRETRHPIHVLMIGSGALHMKNPYKNIALHALGRINSEGDLAKFFNAADLFIYPTKAESFGLVLAEAIACGTPCISFDTTAVGELVQDNKTGYLIKAYDTGDFSKKTLAHFDRPAGELANLRKSCVEFAMANFSLEKIADAYYDFFASIIEAQGENWARRRI